MPESPSLPRRLICWRGSGVKSTSPCRLGRQVRQSCWLCFMYSACEWPLLNVDGVPRHGEALVQLVEVGEITAVQLKVEQVRVRLDATGRVRLGQRDVALLEGPADEDLRDGHVVLSSKRRSVPKSGVISTVQRTFFATFWSVGSSKRCPRRIGQ